MGKEAEVEAFWPDGSKDAGRLQYERTPKLIFRGAERRVFTGERLAGVAADGRDLVLAGGARFCLPTPAASWADAILHPRGRLDKLGVKPGLRVAVLNLDDPDFAAELLRLRPVVPRGEARPAVLRAPTGGAEELAAIGALAPPARARGGALWVVSLKGKAARVRDVEVMAAARALIGLVTASRSAPSPRPGPR